MKSLSSLWLLGAALTAPGVTACVDSAAGLGTGLLDAGLRDSGPTSDAGVRDSGIPDGAVDSVFNPEAEHVFEEPTVIFEPSPGSAIMQGGDIKMVWTGRRYLVLWQRNVSGRVELVAQSIESQGGAYTNPQLVAPSASGGGVIGYYDVVVREGQAALVRSLGSEGLFFTRLNDVGVPVEPASLLPPLNNLMSIAAWNDGFLVVGLISQPLRALELDTQGNLLSSYELPQARRGFISPNADNGLSILWADRNNPPEDTDFVYISRFDSNLRLVAESQEVYRSNNAIPLFLGPPGSANKVVIKDLNSGPVFLDLSTGQRTQLGPAGYNDVVIEHDIDKPRFFLVRETGNLDGRLLSTGFNIRAVDYGSDRLGPERTVHSDPRSCVEDVALASSGDRIGVAFTTGCSQRKLHFVEIEARRP